MKDATGCVNGGGVIETYTGKLFSVFDPKPEDIDIRDIAHALSLVCRFGGHCKFHYSVAQHSLLVELDIFQRWGAANWNLRLAALLHDASEAYIADICRPVKIAIANYAEIEARLQSAIWNAFGVTFDERTESIVKESDNAVLKTEAVQVMKSGGSSWGIEKVRRAPFEILPEHPNDMERAFRDIFDSICRERERAA